MHTVSLVTTQASLRIDVTRLEKPSAPGRYRVTVDDARLTTADDEGLLEAPRLYKQAVRARQDGKASALVEAGDQFQQALDRWRAAGERRWAAQALLDLAIVRAMRSQNAQGLDDMRQVAAIADEIGAPRLKARALQGIGFIRKATGDSAAGDAYREALAILAHVNDPETESATLNNLAIVYNDLGDRQKALEYYLKALELARAMGDHAAEATRLHNIGAFHADVADHQRAIEYLDQALTLTRASGDRRGEGATLMSLGQSDSALGDSRKGLELILESLRVRREMGDRRGEGEALSRAGLAYAATGDEAKADEHYRLALDIFRAISDREGQSDVLRVIGRRAVEAGRPAVALDSLREALEIAQSLSAKQRIAITLHWLARAERDLGNVTPARQHSEVALVSRLADVDVQAARQQQVHG